MQQENKRKKISFAMQSNGTIPSLIGAKQGF